jgi:hypothetical protein
MPALLDLIAQVLEARTGVPSESPDLRALEVEGDPLVTHVLDDELLEFVGEWPYPPEATGEQPETTIEVSLGNGHLVAHHPFQGTFKLYLQPDGTFHLEDSFQTFVPVRNPDGSVAGLVEQRMTR